MGSWAYLIAMAVLVPAFWLLNRHMHRRSDRKLTQPLEAAAQRLGGTAVRPRRPGYYPELEIVYGPATIRTSGRLPAPFTTFAGWTARFHAIVELGHGYFPSFVLKPRGSFSRKPRFGIGSQFDNQFVVECDDEQAVRALWTPRAADLMTRLGNPTWCGEGRVSAIDGKIVAGGSKLEFTRLQGFGRETTYDMLFALFEELVNAATSAERSRPSPGT